MTNQFKNLFKGTCFWTG